MAVELHGTICVEAPPAPCDGKQREATWTNTFGIPLFIVGGYVWQGIGRGCKADVGFQLYIKKNAEVVPQLMRVGMWDHYENPCAAEDNISPINLGGHYFVLEPGGSLTLCYGATLVGEQDPSGFVTDKNPAGLLDSSSPLGMVTHQYYFANIMGQQQQAYLLFSLTKPA